MERQKLTTEERMNLISELQIRFDKLKKETGVLSGALTAQVAPAPPAPAPPVMPKVLAEKGIGPDIDIKDEEKEDEIGKEEPVEKDQSNQASAVVFIMAKIVRWKVPGLYQQKAHQLLTKIQESPDILTRNENGEAVVYGNAIPGSIFKSLF